MFTLHAHFSRMCAPGAYIFSYIFWNYKVKKAMNVINVRDTSTMTWTDEAIPYDEEMLETQVALWGRENVRVITLEELERSIERLAQEREYEQAVAQDAAVETLAREEATTPPPLSLEQLRARRLAFFEPPPAPRRSVRLAKKKKKT